jgi:glycosyltransferase involved in cell wall biosynthesis
MPYFSLLMPAYNEAATITETIGSLLLQSFDDWELIIVDDGSTDQTASIVKQLATTDQRIKLIHGSHAGRGAARNLTLQHATGEVYIPCDADDLYFCDMLAQHYNIFQREPDTQINASLSCIACDQTWQKGFLFSLPWDEREIRTRLKDKHKMGFIHAGSAYHKSLFEAHQFDPTLAACEDLEFLLRAAPDARIRATREPFILYRGGWEQIFSFGTYQANAKAHDKALQHFWAKETRQAPATGPETHATSLKRWGKTTLSYIKLTTRLRLEQRNQDVAAWGRVARSIAHGGTHAAHALLTKTNSL